MRSIATLFLIATLVGCGVRGADTGDSGNTGSGSSTEGNGTGGTDGGSCEVADMRSWVNDNMHDYYLFSDQVPVVNLNDYDSPETLIKDLRVLPYDKYSYITDAAQSTAYFEEGKRFGFGWILERSANDDLVFALVEPDSPLANAGVIRGETLLAIDGIDLPTFANLERNVQDQHLGAGDDVVSPTFTVGNGVTSRNVIVTKGSYTMHSVIDTRVVNHNGSKVGYLHFFTFIEPSSAELATAFAELAAADVDELVLDLRYNSGGRINIAAELAGYIGGGGTQGKTFATYAFNNKYASHNESLDFETHNNALGLSRVFALTTDRTCSASEMVINGLRPFIDVVTVGSTSCGKPYGTSGRTSCGKVMHALEVEFQNASGVGGYFDGIGADCAAADNPHQTLGSANENLFSSALGYMDTGSCQQVAYRSAYRRTLPDLLNPLRDQLGGL